MTHTVLIELLVILSGLIFFKVVLSTKSNFFNFLTILYKLTKPVLTTTARVMYLAWVINFKLVYLDGSKKEFLSDDYNQCQLHGLITILDRLYWILNTIKDDHGLVVMNKAVEQLLPPLESILGFIYNLNMKKLECEFESLKDPDFIKYTDEIRYILTLSDSGKI